MILSVSRRTDIPAFYSEWFFNRLREGSVCVRNPMNERQVSRIKLSPEVVDCIVFWSKNPAPMLERLSELAGYDYYFQYTVNDYGTEVEPRVPPLSERLETFKRLSAQLGRERVIWRYDPIIFTQKYTPEHHLESLAKIAAALRGCTEKCVFSFVDVYPSKNSGSLNRLQSRQLSPAELDSFAAELSRICRENSLAPATCAEGIDLAKHGIQHNACIDPELIARITGCGLSIKSDAQRKHCRCVKCDDIGSYDTCPHGCVYCYANYRPQTTANAIRRYDAGSPLLCGSIDPSLDRVTDRAVKSSKAAGDSGYVQLSLF